MSATQQTVLVPDTITVWAENGTPVVERPDGTTEEGQGIEVKKGDRLFFRIGRLAGAAKEP